MKTYLKQMISSNKTKNGNIKEPIEHFYTRIVFTILSRDRKS